MKSRSNFLHLFSFNSQWAKSVGSRDKPVQTLALADAQFLLRIYNLLIIKFLLIRSKRRFLVFLSFFAETLFSTERLCCCHGQIRFIVNVVWSSYSVSYRYHCIYLSQFGNIARSGLLCVILITILAPVVSVFIIIIIIIIINFI